MSTWKDVLRAQHEELGRLEELDSKLDNPTLNSDIDKFLRKKPSISTVHKSSSKNQSQSFMLSANNASDINNFDFRDDIKMSSNSKPPDYDSINMFASSIKPNEEEFINGSQSVEQHDEEFCFGNDSTSNPPSGKSTPRGTRRGSTSKDKQGVSGIPSGAPETQVRFLSARLKLANKQIEETNELRKQLQEQNSDLQKQLKNEREENKLLRKRISTLEAENKRSSTKTASHAQAIDNNESLAQEILSLKKDLQTAERIAKQAESNVNAKDVQLKRALESINRLKAQIQETQQTSQGGNSEDRHQLEAAEARIRVLEKQRSDLISAFRKQMKLIDVLKRQKVHIEAARMIAFTEDEFMKALDWNT